jgi:hypothetical protein
MKTYVLGFTFGIVVSLLVGAVQARDDGRYMQSPLKPWFDSLRSGKGPCCSDADGFAISDPDWESKNGHYRVRIEKEWIEVPDDAVITEPNRVGRTMVWPIKGALGISIQLHARQHDLIRALGLLHRLSAFQRESCVTRVLEAVARSCCSHWCRDPASSPLIF